jgi:N-methylhydantoinase B
MNDGRPAMPSRPVADLLTSAVVREAFGSIVREMRRAMVRSSYSSIIYEGYDFSCVLVDGQGRLVSESGEDHPFHIIPVGTAVPGVLGLHREIGPDDIFLHNDPYTGGTHLNDVAVIWPVLGAAGKPVFFIVIRSHWGDIGGMTPGSLNGAAVDIFQEGLRLNYLKIPRSGNSEVLRLIFDNVRASREAVSDFHSVLGICKVAERRLREVLSKYGVHVVAAATDTILDASERRLRAAIAALPSGTCHHRAYLDGNAAAGHPLHVQLALTIDGDRIHADFTGSSPQVRGPLNAGPAIAPTSVLTVLKSFLDPRGAINSGTLRVLSVTAPPGTIVCATAPAPCGGMNEVRFACDAAVMGALGQVIPDRITGDVRGTSNHTYIGNRSFIFYEYPSGGTGGSHLGDGSHAVRAFNEGENVSIQSAEVVETTFPLRVLRNEIRPDSAGPGCYRGGCGLVREVEVGCDDAVFSLLSDRNIVPPAGVNGGASGAPNHYRVLRAGREVTFTQFPGKVAGFPLARGDVVVMQSSGGGGWGDPCDRPDAALDDDWADGLLTDAGRASYRKRPRTVSLTVDPGIAEPHLCRLAADVADGFGASAGALIELQLARGPARRYWVAGVDPALCAGSIALPTLPPAASMSVRLLAAATPLTCCKKEASSP